MPRREIEVMSVPLLECGRRSARAAQRRAHNRPAPRASLRRSAQHSSVLSSRCNAFRCGQHIFYAKERSECFWRVCCAPRHTLFMEFKSSANVPPQLLFMADIDQLSDGNDDGAGYKFALASRASVAACEHLRSADGMYLHAGAIPPNTPNTLKAANPACVGFAAQPRFGGGLAPSVNVMERAVAAAQGIIGTR